MLEIRNLTKIYTAKGGVSVRALDGVSLTFEDTGMVFLLGKSGSGKSTLLNLCGGLDRPDSGEIIVKGRGSETFTAGDFDSYRNTYIGFIFQEYNILDEFTVEANVALALELQGKAKDREKIQEILRAVELENFAKRKPNTLSGGQKQRVAIARALVKEPEIIMADEPTGALDSATGRQVFDTLKKLSEDKLVLVVSHDREFAELYADRIIELKDGKVISDVKKNKIAAKKASENVSFIGTDLISVKSGAALTDTDLQNIRAFIASSEKQVLIANGNADIEKFYRQAHVDENGSREEFCETKPEDIRIRHYRQDESEFIKSRLPMRHAAKIGASSMKVKPVRLFFTIFLTFISFVMFGLFSTLMLFNEKQVLGESLKVSNDEYLQIVKKYQVTVKEFNANGLTGTYENPTLTQFKESDVDEIRTAYGNEAVIAFTYSDYSIVFSIENISSQDMPPLYENQIFGFGVTGEGSSYRSDKILWGKYPAGTDEVMISDYTFECLKAAGSIISPDGTETEINSFGDLKNVKISLWNNRYYTVCGVYKAQTVPDKFDDLKTGGIGQSRLKEQWETEIRTGFYNYLLVSDDFYAANEKYFTHSYQPEEIIGVSTYFKDYTYDYDLTDENNNTISLNYFSKHTENGLPLYGFEGMPLASLRPDEIAVSREVWAEWLYNAIQNSDGYWHLSDEDEHGISYYDKLQALQYGYYDDDDNNRVYLDEEKSVEFYRDIKTGIIDAYNVPLPKTEYEFTNGYTQLSTTASVAGFYIEPCGVNDRWYEAAYLGDSLYDFVLHDPSNTWTEYETKYDAAGGKYAAVFVEKSDAAIDKTLDKLYHVKEDDSFFDVNSETKETIGGIVETVSIFAKVFLYIGLALALFAMLMLFNFISVSITYKKKEIGILRAVGARGTDVFKIFYAESAIITAISLVLSIIASIVLCSIINNIILQKLALPLTLFVFSPLCAALLAGIAVFTSVVSTFLPVYSIAKKRPVESIRAL